MSSSDRNWVETEVKREIHFDDFANSSIPVRLPAGFSVMDSPVFTCFGSEWQLRIHTSDQMRIIMRKVPAIDISIEKDGKTTEVSLFDSALLSNIQKES